MKRFLKKSKTSNKMMMRKNNNIHSLYIHVPFCEHLCDYCDFPKLQYFRTFAEKYLTVLEKELTSYQINHTLKTIYVGGGTPTALEDDLFERLLKIISKYSKGVEEYTFEANPESLSENKLRLMKEYGVNRISIGVESTDERILKSINRHHTFNDVKVAVELLRENGISNINLDLIIGLPNVSMKMLEKDIRNILSLNPDHISCYSLTVHEHTVFYINGINPPSDEFAYDAYKMINSLLEENGYEHYEVSNWAKENRRSEHNLTYWRNEHYYGVGLGASGYLENIRFKNTTNLKDYLSNKFAGEEEIVTISDLEEYQVMLNLRTSEGLDLNKFNKIFNKDLYACKKNIIDSYIASNHLILKENTLIPTFEGMMILDKICLDLFE